MPPADTGDPRDPRDQVIAFPTPYGEGRLHRRAATDPVACLVLGHGAGNGVASADLEALADALPDQGITVVRLEQPWHVAGRKVATPPATLDVGLAAGVAALPDADRAVPLVLGGRSAGARSAARCASDLGAVGAVLLAFPLHPPGRPERSRRPELAGAGVPLLVVQGERDAMGRPDELEAAALPADLDLAVVPGADHGMKVLRSGALTQEEALGVVVETVLEWIVREAVG